MSVALPRTKVICTRVLLHVYMWVVLPGRATVAITEGGLINRESPFSSTWATRISVGEAVSRFG